MSRVFDDGCVWTISEEQLERALKLLGDHVRLAWRPGGLVAIGRGGIPPALKLGLLLNVPVFEIDVRSNQSQALRSPALEKVEIDHDALTVMPAFHELLVVDDICGTGQTLTALSEALLARGKAVQIRTATLCRNAGSRFHPDAWIWTVRDWVSFPWEVAPSNQVLRSIGPPSLQGRS